MRTFEIPLSQIPVGAEITLDQQLTMFRPGETLVVGDPGPHYNKKSRRRIPLILEPQIEGHHRIILQALETEMLTLRVEGELPEWLQDVLVPVRQEMAEAWNFPSPQDLQAAA